MKVKGNIIMKWLSNKGLKATNFGHFISVELSNDEIINRLMEDIKGQFPMNKAYINDNTSNKFISIDI